MDASKPANSVAQYMVGAALAVAACLGMLVWFNNSQAAVAYNNSAIANLALQYVNQQGSAACTAAHKPGDTGGQCREFVNCIVWMASGGRQNLGGSDYYQTFLNAGGTRIANLDGLQRGDIIQEGEGLHTFIIVNRVSGSTFTVVDSNSDYKETVKTYNRPVTLNSTNRAYRMGQASTANLADGSFIRVAGNNQVYVLVGRAPVKVYDWRGVGGAHDTTDITAAEFNTLPKVPANGTFLTAYGTNQIYEIRAGQAVLANGALPTGAKPVVVDGASLTAPGDYNLVLAP